MRTSQLLSETQEQASQLARQEEQVLQNIEELKLTQTEAARQSEQFVAFTNTVNHTLIRAEYKTDGSLLYANTLFLRSLGYSGNREIDGKHISTFIHEKDQEWFNDIWTKLAAGGVHFEGYMKLITKQGQDFWTVSTYTCMRKEDGSVDKILFLAINSTEQKKISLDFEGQIAAINKLSPKAEFSPDGSFIFYNELFKDALAYNDADLENYSVFDLFSESELERVNEIWDQVLRGNAYQGQLRIKGKNGEEQWFRSSFSVVEDMYGDVSKIVFLGNEITKEKQLENSMREQNIKLKEKEEELRLQSIDLQKELDALNLAWDHERSIHRDETFQFSNIIDKLSYPIIMCNNMSFILYLNPAAENYFRIKQKEVIHEKIHKLLSKSQNSSEIAAFADPAKQISPCNLKSVQIVLADGKICQEKVSIIKSELGAEHSNALIIHTDSN